MDDSQEESVRPETDGIVWRHFGKIAAMASVATLLIGGALGGDTQTFGSVNLSDFLLVLTIILGVLTIASGIVESVKSEYAEWTKNDLRVALKKFYRWLRGGEEYPREVAWLRCGTGNSYATA